MVEALAVLVDQRVVAGVALRAACGQEGAQRQTGIAFDPQQPEGHQLAVVGHADRGREHGLQLARIRSRQAQLARRG